MERPSEQFERCIAQLIRLHPLECIAAQSSDCPTHTLNIQSRTDINTNTNSNNNSNNNSNKSNNSPNNINSNDKVEAISTTMRNTERGGGEITRGRRRRWDKKDNKSIRRQRDKEMIATLCNIRRLMALREDRGK